MKRLDKLFKDNNKVCLLKVEDSLFLFKEDFFFITKSNIGYKPHKNMYAYSKDNIKEYFSEFEQKRFIYFK